ncbi:XRE family transcriptional regulator [Rhodococcus erythropolis]|uniref:XRE family transcriptional regulator n=1 Tax=Rhodococcus erythropolis TaxID=1833 RepID=UPI001BE90BA0|nr:XRE family transcriptional regulator [Rhodococcus erythropolis]MBT2268812.1 XRE family transcriptional regulator [Rhodococcus erythropolis]
MFLLSLDEIERVKRANGICTLLELERRTGMTRKSWSTAIKTRRPTPQILDALSTLGAKPSKVLIADEVSAAA